MQLCFVYFYSHCRKCFCACKLVPGEPFYLSDLCSLTQRISDQLTRNCDKNAWLTASGQLFTWSALIHNCRGNLGTQRPTPLQSLRGEGRRDDLPPADGSSTWQKLRRIYVRPRTGPQSPHLWWPAVAKLQAASMPISSCAMGQTDGRTAVSLYSRLGRGHNNNTIPRSNIMH